MIQWPLVGRTEELAVIAGATRAAVEGPRGIVLSGSAGVGKTRLAHEAVTSSGTRSARRHWIVGTASARGVPLGAFADISSDFGPDPLRRVREVIDGLIAPGNETVIGVDDAHLLDDLSAFTVHQLVTRRLATVILTIRTGEHPPDAITAIWKDHHLERLDLQPLSLSETTMLVEQVLGGPVQSLSARRLWRYTQGNVLYLRHLVESEVDAGRLKHHADMWLWDGQPVLSPTLAELVEARITQIPSAVQDVLDVLAVAEPLDAEVITAITDPDALAEAELLGLATVSPSGRSTQVRLAHPMFGEVRRTGSARLRQLAGRVATELGQRGGTDPRDLVRRAMLTIGSDLAPDAELLVAAAWAATQLLDVRLAVTLAERAVAAGGGPQARLAQAMANFWLERPTEAEEIFAEIADDTTGPTHTQLAVLRVSNLVGQMGRVASAEQVLNALPVEDADSRATANALRALIDVVRGQSSAALNRARAVLAHPPADDLATMHSIFVEVSALGELGRIDEVEPAIDIGYRLSETSAAVSHARFQLSFLQANAYRFAGALAMVDAANARIRDATIDVPFEESWHNLLAGMAAMSRGGLAEARRVLQESLAYLGSAGSGRVIKGFGRSWLATVTGMAGQAAAARREFTAIEWWAQDADACVWDPERSIAEAWTCAAEGDTSQSISIMRNAAALESERGRPAWEVLLLQTATQFGDHTTATRLAELACQVQGPRAPAAAEHAAALAAGDGDRLVESACRYEEFGDRLAAADASAHAAVAYQNAGLDAAARSASATALRLAGECQGALTPAIRAVRAVKPFTARQRVIISLAAQGLSNKDIAEELTMSVRSVEGHLFRASLRVGANNREQLIAILRGSRAR